MSNLKLKKFDISKIKDVIIGKRRTGISFLSWDIKSTNHSNIEKDNRPNTEKDNQSDTDSNDSNIPELIFDF